MLGGAGEPKGGGGATPQLARVAHADSFSRPANGSLRKYSGTRRVVLQKITVCGVGGGGSGEGSPTPLKDNIQTHRYYVMKKDNKITASGPRPVVRILA